MDGTIESEHFSGKDDTENTITPESPCSKVSIELYEVVEGLN